MVAGILTVIFILALLGLIGGFVAEMIGVPFLVGFSIGVSVGVGLLALLELEA